MYLVIEIQSSGSSAAITPIFTTENWAQAESEFHRLCSIAAVSTAPKHTVVFMDDGGYVFEAKNYDHTT